MRTRMLNASALQGMQKEACITNREMSKVGRIEREREWYRYASFLQFIVSQSMVSMVPFDV